MKPRKVASVACFCAFSAAVAAFIPFNRAAVPKSPELELIGKVQCPSIREASGLVKSRKHSGVYWTINDSGNPPHLFAIDRQGKLLAEYVVKGAVNLDWEALALGEDDRLYIGDVGNMGGLELATRRVYCLKEPDPASARATPGEEKRPPEISVEQIHSFTFPGKPCDVEGMFYHKKNLYLVRKAQKEPAVLYRLALDKSAKAKALVEVCSLREVPVVTDAALSADGRRLALCSYSYVAAFELKTDEPLESLKQKTPMVVHFPPTDIEGCTWDGDDLILVSEDRKIYRLRF